MVVFHFPAREGLVTLVDMSQAAPSPTPANDPAPVFGIVLMGGPLSGALVRDVRLANALVAQGYTVHVWWAMDRLRKSPLDARIHEHWLFHGYRYRGRGKARPWRDSWGRLTSRIFSDRARAHHSQKHPAMLEALMQGLTRHVCNGVESDQRLLKRFADEMTQAGITHMLPMLSILCAWVLAARSHMPRPAKYMVTFQGYELYANYARSIGRESDLYRRLKEVADQSDFPAIAVSGDYLERVVEDLGVARAKLVAIPPGVPAGVSMDRDKARAMALKFCGHTGEDDLPIVAYLGRQDSEKGLDLLLYAATMLRRKGVRFHLLIGGPTLFGGDYMKVCRQIAENLRCRVLWQQFLPEQVRTAVLNSAYCIVYPSIHREPFGMVATEALSHGVPAIVPDYGGVAGAIEAGGLHGGLTFHAFDSGSLADTLGKLLGDPGLREQLAAAGPAVAEHYSVDNLVRRVLDNLSLPAPVPESTPEA